jgi:hypothetical protein
MLRRIALLVAVAVTAAAAGSIWSSQAATGPATIRITNRQVKYTRIDVAPRGRTAGDSEIILQLVYNRRVTQRPIGRAELICTYTRDVARSCRGTVFLPNGQLVIGGSLTTRKIYVLAVLGGTRLYDNARGMVTITRLNRNPRRELMFFRLTG